MKRVIWKYELAVEAEQRIKIPHMAELLCVQLQKPARIENLAAFELVPVIWADVDPEAPMTTLGVHVVGTGHVLSDELHRVRTTERGEPEYAWTYLGTVQIPGGAGPLVLHVFHDGKNRHHVG